ncbi:MAG: hypothetical protein ACM3TR_00040 [Caulobacteraceae bacterium]
MSTAQIQQVKNQDVLVQKQNEIDQYIFEQHKDEFAKLGFTVTNTGVDPVHKWVEVGITPYTAENADYIYNIFGKDMVKVTEGVQAVTLTLGTNSSANNAEMHTTLAVADNNAAPQAQKQNEEKGIGTFFHNIWEWIVGIFS